MVRTLLLFLTLSVACLADPAWIELPRPTQDQLDKMHVRLGIDSDRAPTRETTANSLRALYYRPPLAESVIRLDLLSRQRLPARVYWRIAVQVSALNGCDYCLSSTSEALRQVGGEPETVLEREDALGRYVTVLTREPENTKPELIALLRADGWNDEEIFENSPGCEFLQLHEPDGQRSRIRTRPCSSFLRRSFVRARTPPPVATR